MRRSYVYRGILVVASVAVCLTAWGAAQTSPPTASVWQYKAIELPGQFPGDMEKVFNDLGAQRWEYCGAQQAEHRVQGETIRPVVVSIFKRSMAKAGE